MAELLVVAAAISLLLGLLWVGQRRLMYFPFGSVPPPGQIGLTAAQDVVVRTDDGLPLGAWFVPSSDSARARATVLVFNGNAGNRALRAPLAWALSRAGYSVLLLDYRGYGGNPGRPSEAGIVEDARAARRYLTTRSDVDPKRMIYFGESLGTAVALALAVEHPPAALVLRSPFTSMVDVGRVHYPWLPVRWFLWDRYPSLERIGRVNCPTLFIAGERDHIVPTRQTRALYDASGGKKRLLVVPGADHNDPELTAGPLMIQEIVAFLRSVPV